MTFTQFLSILRARRWVALTVLAVTVAIAVVLSLVLPKQYTAASSVVVDFKPDPVSAVVYGGVPSPALMATQVDVIASDRVGMRVVRNLKLAENPQVRAQWQEATDGQGSIEQWLVELFHKQMEVVPSRESSVITITYRAPDPRFAAALANAFADAFIQTSLELRVDPARQYAGFFDARAKEARDNLERAQSRLSAFQKEKGIIATDERLDVENNRLNELSTQLVALQAIAAESRSRQAQAQGRQSDRMEEVLANPVISTLKADMSRAEAKLRELSTRLGDANPQVIEAKANIAELQARIAAETRRVTGGVGVTNTINSSREAQVRAELEAQRAKLLRMKESRDEAAVYLRDVENAQRSYDMILTRQNQSALESQAPQSNVNILTQAVPPLEHSSPRLILNTLLALFIGALLAMGLAMLLEMRDRRVRAIDDIGTMLGLPVLGVLPRPNAKRRHRALPMNQRIMNGLPSPREA